MKRIALRLLWIVGLVLFVPRVVAADRIVYPQHQAARDPQIEYVLGVLQLAVERSGKTYTLQQSSQVMVQSRAFDEISRAGGSVDVVWAMTDPERERSFLPIRIPIDKGLIGWRLAIVRKADADRWRGVRSIEALARFSAGQMHDWPDTAILRANGLPVNTSANYEGLFQQVALQRVDYFPRSVIEIEDELANHESLALAIEPYLVIHYPTAFYFFVSKHRPVLRDDLERGLEAAVADGSFQRLFDRRFGDLASRLGLKVRTVLELNNPLLPPSTPFERKELWFKGVAEGK